MFLNDCELFLSTMTTKPYIHTINKNSTDLQTASRWMAYLGKTFGTTQALASLHYYETLGWITADARKQLSRVLTSLSHDELNNEPSEEHIELTGFVEDLDGSVFTPHVKSLQFIDELGGIDIEGETLFAEIPEEVAKPIIE